MSLQVLLFAPGFFLFIYSLNIIRRIRIKLSACMRRNEPIHCNRVGADNTSRIVDRVRADFPQFFQTIPTLVRPPTNQKHLSGIELHAKKNRTYTLTCATDTCSGFWCTQENHRPVLVLDLDETLVHAVMDRSQIEVNAESFIPLTIPVSNTTFWISVRPGCADFLETLSRDYELVLWTAGTQDYAETVLEYIDPTCLLQYRLFRQHCTFVDDGFCGGHYVKDLSKLKCDLDEVIIVDNNHLSFEFHPDNGVQVEDYVGSADDNVLMELKEVLRISTIASISRNDHISSEDSALINNEISPETDFVNVVDTIETIDADTQVPQDASKRCTSSKRRRSKSKRRRAVPTRRSERIARMNPRRSPRLLACKSKVGSN